MSANNSENKIKESSSLSECKSDTPSLDEGLFFVTESCCPVCQKDITLSWRKISIPYFGEIALISSVCGCGFVFSDTMILSSREPSGYSIVLETSKDLEARVIRSTSGTIEIPELGV